MDEYIVISVDNGLKGGITVMLPDYNIFKSIPMPIIKSKKIIKEYKTKPNKVRNETKYNLNEIKDIFYFLSLNYKKVYLAIEDVFVLGCEGMNSVKHICENFGLLKGIAIGLDIEVVVIRPQIWQKFCFKDIIAEDTKEASIKFCKKNYPNVSLLPTPRCSKLSDGISDSICIGHYLVTKLNEEVNEK